MGQGFFQVPFEVWYSQAKLLLEFTAVLWIIAIIDIGCLNLLIFRTLVQPPRTLGGLFYLPISSLFHSNWSHLVGNTTGLLIFGGVIVLRDPSQLLMVTLVSTFVESGATWLVGRDKARYLGASGIVFGYLGFITARSILEKDAAGAVVLAWLLFSFFFGNRVFFDQDSLKNAKDTVGADRLILDVKWSLWTVGYSFWGIFPGKNPNVSWEGHLFGFVGGVLAAQYSSVLTPWVNQFAAWVQQLR